MDSAAMQVGSLLVVKTPHGTVTRDLSSADMAAIARDPEIMNSPELLVLFDSIEQAAAEESLVRSIYEARGGRARREPTLDLDEALAALGLSPGDLGSR